MIETFAGYLDVVAALSPWWKLALIFTFMAVESSFIPFPSEVVMIPAGFFAVRGEMGGHPLTALVLAVVVGVLGSLAGAYANYFLARTLGKSFLERHGRWFFLSPSALERACEIFNRYGAAMTFVCRMVPAIRQLISIPAGIARMPLVPFTVFTTLGAGIWTAILAAVGWYLGRTAGDIGYLELCQRGKALVGEHLWLAIGAALALVAAHFAISHWVMKGKGK